MRSNYLVCILILLCSFGALLWGSQKMMVRLDNPDSALARSFDEQGWDVASYRAGEYLDLVVDEGEFLYLKSINPLWYVTHTEEDLIAALTPQRDIPGYLNYSQIVDMLMVMQATYPSLVQVHNIGTSWGAIYAENYTNYSDFDHAIWAVKVSANVTDESFKPAFYFVGDHHAREPISTQMCLVILEHLAENYGIDPQVTQILDNSEVWIVPLLNPNGHAIALNQDVWWRKNIRDNNSNHYFDPGYYPGNGDDGVDLNRNYGYRWGYVSSTDNQFAATYHGPQAFSEPEVQAFADLISSKRFLAGISYHTYGQYVMYPYGYMYEIFPPDRIEQHALASEIASQILKYNSTTQHYDAIASWQLYPASGTSDDWIYGTTGAFAYTIEMATTFIPPAADIPLITSQNLNGAMVLLQRMQKKILMGEVTDAQTGLPLPARVWVQGFDDHYMGYPAMYADASSGKYYRLLPVGEYQVNFSLPGYQSQTLMVNIHPDMPTTQDIQLVSSTPIDLEISIMDVMGEPVADASLQFEDMSDTVYHSGLDGRIRIPIFYPGEYRIKVSKPGFSTLRINRQILSPNIYFTINEYADYADDFENQLDMWEYTGTWGRSTLYAWEGEYSLADSPNGNYTPGQNSWCKLISPINLVGVDNADLQFYIMYDLSLDTARCLLQFSVDGQNWQTLDMYMAQSDWTHKSYNLNSFIGSTLYIRFVFISNTSESGSGVYIDNFRIFTGVDSTPVQELVASPVKLSVHPNPFVTKTFISAGGIKNTASQPRIAVYNIRGQRVWESDTLVSKGNAWGFEWDGKDMRGRDLASGVYAIRLYNKNQVLATSKMLKIK